MELLIHALLNAGLGLVKFVSGMVLLYPEINDTFF